MTGVKTAAIVAIGNSPIALTNGRETGVPLRVISPVTRVSVFHFKSVLMGQGRSSGPFLRTSFCGEVPVLRETHKMRGSAKFARPTKFDPLVGPH